MPAQKLLYQCTLSRTGKQFKLSQSTQLMANERETVETAYAGDVIGIYDTGNYQIGDTLTTSKEKLFFEQPNPNEDSADDSVGFSFLKIVV